MNKPISDKKLKYLKKLKLKKYRLQENLFLVEGFHLVKEAIKQKIVIEIFASLEFENATIVDFNIIKTLSSTKNPQPIIALCKIIESKKELSNKVLILENINDPGNLGTLIRSAYAFGYKDIVIEGVDIYNPKVLLASQGAFFYVNLIQTKNAVNFIKEKLKNYFIYVTFLGENTINFEKTKNKKNLVLVLGNEANGVSEKMQKIASKLIYIKTNFESLNIASAGAILLNYYKNI